MSKNVWYLLLFFAMTQCANLLPLTLMQNLGSVHHKLSELNTNVKKHDKDTPLNPNIVLIEKACAEGENCPICLKLLKDIKQDKSIKEPQFFITPCKHIICRPCCIGLREASMGNVHCPLCRQKMLDLDNFLEKGKK
jgi:hypothetical protein